MSSSLAYLVAVLVLISGVVYGVHIILSSLSTLTIGA